MVKQQEISILPEQRQSATAAFWSIADLLRSQVSADEYGPLLLAVLAQAQSEYQNPFWVRYSRSGSKKDDNRFSHGWPEVDSRWISGQFTSLDRLEEQREYTNMYSEKLILESNLSPEILRKAVQVLLDLDIPPKALTSIAIEVALRLLSDSGGTLTRGMREISAAKPGLANLVRDLLALQPGESVYDPSVGLGSLLGFISTSFTPGKIEYWGQDINQSVVGFARFIFALRQENLHLAWGNSLNNPPFQNDALRRFDAVIVDPPWGLRAGMEKPPFGGLPGRDPREDYHLHLKTDQEVFLLINGLEAANPTNGRVVALLPHGVLFRSGTIAKARAQIIRMSSLALSAVISLKPMFTRTGMPFVVAIFAPSKGEAETTFIDATGDDFYLPNGDLRPEALEKIALTIQKRETKTDYCATVTRDEILNNDSSWSPQRYIPVEAMEVSDPLMAYEDLKQSTKALGESEDRLHQLLHELGTLAQSDMHPQS